MFHDELFLPFRNRTAQHCNYILCYYDILYPVFNIHIGCCATFNPRAPLQWYAIFINDKSCTSLYKSIEQYFSGVGLSWASCQMRKIAGCACAGNAGNVFPATDFKGDRQLTILACITVRRASDVMYVGIAKARWQGKCPRHSGACTTRNFTYLVRGPCVLNEEMILQGYSDIQYSDSASW